MTLRIFPNEQFKEIDIEKSLTFRYAISNYGRLISFTNTFEDGRIVKGNLTAGFRIFRYKLRSEGKILYRHKIIYRLVAEHFLPKTSEDQQHVIHLDHNQSNDHVNNLKWVTEAERWAHFKENPKTQEALKKLIEFNKKRDGHKLTSTDVMHIKKRLADPNRKTRLKMIAKQYGISEMQLHRIRTGENWGHVKI